MLALLALSASAAFSLDTFLPSGIAELVSHPVSREVVERGRRVLEVSPTPKIVRAGRVLSMFMPQGVNNTIINAIVERMSATPSFSDVKGMVYEGKFKQAFSALARGGRHAVARRLGHGTIDIGNGVEPISVTSLWSQLKTETDLCSDADLAQSLKNQLDEQVNELFGGQPCGSSGVQDSRCIDLALIQQGISCACAIDVSNSAFQELVDAAYDIIDQPTPYLRPSNEDIYDLVVNAIDATFSSDVLCNGNCKTALEQIIKYAYELGTYSAEVELKSWMNNDNIAFGDTVAEEEQLARTTPECICSIEFKNILTNAKTATMPLISEAVDFIDGTISLQVGDGSIPNLIDKVQTSLKSIIGKTGFGGPSGLCSGSCRSLESAIWDLELTFLVGIPYKQVIDYAATLDDRRQLAIALPHRLLAGRKLAGRRLTEVYDSTIDTIATAIPNCGCDYLNVDKLIDTLDIIDDDWLTKLGAGDDDANQTTIMDAVFEIDKELVANWFFSQYGVCGGFNDGCVRVQTELARLFGLVEENFAAGGLLKDSNLLAETPKTGIVDWLPTFAPCYCLLNYANAFDVMKPVAQGLVAFDELVGGTDVPDVAGFMLSMVGTCNTDECKSMMNMTYVFFSDIFFSGGWSGADAQQCTATAVADCAASSSQSTPSPPPSPTAGNTTSGRRLSEDDWWSTSQCTPPSQGSWYGSLLGADYNGIDMDGTWQSIYWGVCFFGSYCPAPGVSAYTMTTTVSVASAADVDTAEEQDAIRDAYVDMLNQESGTSQIDYDDVSVSVSGADVTFELTTNSEAVKVQTENTLADGGPSNPSLGVPLASGASFAPAAVTTIVHPPPPPAPGYQEDVGESNIEGSNTGSGGDSDDLTMIIGAAVGGVGGCVVLALCAFAIMRKSQSTAEKNRKKKSTQGWQAGGGSKGPVNPSHVEMKMPL